MGFGDGFSKQYPGLENSGSTDIKVTGSLLVTGDLTVLGSSNVGGGGGSGGGDALTGSTNIFRADQIISGNLNIDGTITAKQFNVVTSSVLYTSGSTKFGDTPDDTHQFTGSVISSVGFTGSISASNIQGIIPVSKGGTGQSTFSSNSLLIASGSNAFTSLTGSNAADKYVVAWDATGSNYVLTASSGGGLNITPNAQGETLISSGTTFISARPIAGSNIGLDFASGSITVKLSSSLDNLASISSSWFTGSLKGTAETASYVNPLTQSVYINGNLSASAGLTGSFSGSIASASMITNFVTDVQNIASATGIRAISGSSNINVTAGQYPTASLNTSISLDNITLTNKITAVTGSFQLLETVSASSLMVGDKYIIIMSGAADHTTLNGSGILWGSGTLDPTSYTDLSASAAIIFNSGSDVLQAYPGLSSSFTGSFNGDGSQITNISAGNLTGVVKTVSATAPMTASIDTNGLLTVALNSGSVNFNSITVSLGASGSIPLVASLNASSSILISSSSLSGAVNIDLNKTLTNLTSVSSSGFTGSFSGSAAGLTNVASSLIYASATPALAVSQIVALSGGLIAAAATDRLKANGFGVIVGSSSAAGYTVQTNNEALVAFSSSNRSLLVTGSEFYVSSSGTASLYEDIAGNPGGVYATQIGYLNRVVGTNYYIIISPRPFGLVY